MDKHMDSLHNGVDTLAAVKAILGDKFAFAQLVVYMNNGCITTPLQSEMLDALGWTQEGDFYWKGKPECGT